MANGKRESVQARERGRKWVNQHNYSLMQTTPRCLYSNELMRLQTGKKQFHHCSRLLQATKENELSPDLNGDRVFTQARINIWLPDLMSVRASEAKSLSCKCEAERGGEKITKTERQHHDAVIVFCSSRADSVHPWHICMTMRERERKIDPNYSCSIATNISINKYVFR